MRPAVERGGLPGWAGLPALVLAACTASGTAPDAGYVALGAAVDALAEQALAGGPIAGLSVAVLRGDVLVLNEGYGAADRERGIAATADTVYDIASVSKLLTAAAVLRLVDERLVRLDDDVASLLAAFPNRDQGRRITLQQLLSHTSGLADYEEADTERVLADGTPLTTAFVLEFLRDRPLEFEPGSRWSYSNTGFYLLALVVEQVTGRSFGDYLREEVTMPLGLAATFPCDDDRLPDRRARGYRARDGGLVPSLLYALPDLLGDGGLCSTAADLARLPTALQNSGVLSKASLERMRARTRLPGGVAVDYGLGVRRGTLDGRPLWGHTGGQQTYWSTVAAYPRDGVTIAVLVNTDGAPEDALTIEGNVARLVLGLGAAQLREVAPSRAELRACSGRYGNAADSIRIFSEGGRLLREVPGGNRAPLPLLYQGNGAWGRADYPMDRLVFHTAGGRTVGLSEYYNGVFATYRHALSGGED